MKLVLLIIVFLFAVTLVDAQTPPVIYVAGDGTGDFNCDGNSDQIEINKALDFVAKNTNKLDLSEFNNGVYLTCIIHA